MTILEASLNHSSTQQQIEIRELGAHRTSLLDKLIRKHLGSFVKDAQYLNDALPEYCLVLLANRHDQDKIREELGGILGNPEAAHEFTQWLMQAYEQLLHQNDTLKDQKPDKNHEQDSDQGQKKLTDATSNTINTAGMDEGEERPYSRRFGINRAFSRHRGFQTALRQATMPFQTKFSSRMAVEHHCAINNDSHGHGNYNHAAAARDRDYLDKDLDAFMAERQAVKRGLLSSKQDNPVPSATLPVAASSSSSLSSSFSLNASSLSLSISTQADSQQPAKKETSQQPAVVIKKCPFYPSCPAPPGTCAFYHPSEPCMYFPNCINSRACLFIHPAIPCKFQAMCANPVCNYAHTESSVSSISSSSSLSSGSSSGVSVSHNGNATLVLKASILCKFHPKCAVPSCPFLHPSQTTCKYGLMCTRPDCIFAHPTGRNGLVSRSKVMAPCRFGKSCTRMNCPFQHEQPEPAISNGSINQTSTSVDCKPSASSNENTTPMNDDSSSGNPMMA